VDPHAPFDLLRTDGMQIRACKMHQRMHLRSLSPSLSLFLSLSLSLSPSLSLFLCPSSHASPCSPHSSAISARTAGPLAASRGSPLSPLPRATPRPPRKQSCREAIFITGQGYRSLCRARLTAASRTANVAAENISLFRAD